MYLEVPCISYINCAVNKLVGHTYGWVQLLGRTQKHPERTLKLNVLLQPYLLILKAYKPNIQAFVSRFSYYFSRKPYSRVKVKKTTNSFCLLYCSKCCTGKRHMHRQLASTHSPGPTEPSGSRDWWDELKKDKIEPPDWTLRWQRVQWILTRHRTLQQAVDLRRWILTATAGEWTPTLDLRRQVLTAVAGERIPSRWSTKVLEPPILFFYFMHTSSISFLKS